MHEGKRRTETRTRGSWACPRWCLGIEVEVNERVQLLERERLRCLVVNEHTLPFLRGLLIALEHYHLIVLDISEYPTSACVCWGVKKRREEGK